jgi:ABC-2 type transport system ATP-binding protein
VVIIERGRILETGTIDDVLKKSAPRRTVAVRLLPDGNQSQQLIRELLQTPFVENAREVTNEIHFELAGDESAACDVLDKLIEKKFRVVEFRQTRANLEDIFMKVTKGGVQ